MFKSNLTEEQRQELKNNVYDTVNQLIDHNKTSPVYNFFNTQIAKPKLDEFVAQGLPLDFVLNFAFFLGYVFADYEQYFYGDSEDDVSTKEMLANSLNNSIFYQAKLSNGESVTITTEKELTAEEVADSVNNLPPVKAKGLTFTGEFVRLTDEEKDKFTKFLNRAVEEEIIGIDACKVDICKCQQEQ